MKKHKHMKFEIRYDDKGKIDEVLAHGNFHLERMDNGYFWIGLYLPGNKMVHVDLTSKSLIKASVRDDR